MKYTVAVQCFTYNHEPYIRDALEGFVIQQTNFPFVAIVHDDASTDGTANIIREYAEKYPDIIKPIYESENQYSKYDGSLGRIMNAACEATGAKYIAMCEGDDYWTDPLKLQKQVDFLESHPDYSMCFGNAIEHWEDGSQPDKIMAHYNDGPISSIKLYEQWKVPTASIIVRANLFSSEMYKKVMSIPKLAYGDVPLVVSCDFIGNIYFMNQIFLVYRKHIGGVSLALDYNRWPQLRTAIKVSKTFGKDYVKQEQISSSKLFIPALKSIFKNFPYNVIIVIRLLWFAPTQSLRELKWIWKAIQNHF